MTFAEALAQLITKVDIERQAVVKLEVLAKALRENPSLEELLISLTRSGSSR